MPVLLLREASTGSLSALVEKAQKRTAPLQQYYLQINNGHLDLVCLSRPDRKVNPVAADEGFESDIDNLSLVSSDNDSFTTEKILIGKAPSKITETDSANGSSSSDSDTEVGDLKAAENALEKITSAEQTKETFNLVDCVCYTDVNCSDILIFVIQKEALVFKFDNVNHLQSFYKHFTTLKAVTNQRFYNTNFATKFSLSQRTDQDGVTRIEITRDPETRYLPPEQPVSIPKYENDDAKFSTIIKSNSIESILDVNPKNETLVNKNSLRKVWNSAEDLLEPPKRPARRKKGKAPQPPKAENRDVYSGQYVRVNVDLDKHRLMTKSSSNEPHPKKLQAFKPSFTSFLKSKDKQLPKCEPKKLDTAKLMSENSWTNSMPRMLRKPRAKPESKNFVPMAYRYIDTAQDYPLPYSTKTLVKSSAFTQSAHFLKTEGNQSISNRLFGLSPKLRDFPDDYKWTEVCVGSKNNNLKSVIKSGKDEQSRRKNDKKVTFSAYTTVQVV